MAASDRHVDQMHGAGKRAWLSCRCRPPYKRLWADVVFTETGKLSVQLPVIRHQYSIIGYFEFSINYRLIKSRFTSLPTTQDATAERLGGVPEHTEFERLITRTLTTYKDGISEQKKTFHNLIQRHCFSNQEYQIM